MIKLECPICEAKIELPGGAKAGERITCSNCSAQLQLFKHEGKFVLGCALCPEPVFDPAICDECERRRERKELLEEGRL